MARILIGNIKGPQGIPGAKGDKGDVGPRGPAGPSGSVDNTTPIEFTEAAQRANLVSGDSIATLFGKQKKWNADIEGGFMPYTPTAFVLYNEDTKTEALRKIDNPTLLFGARNVSYRILFSDAVGDSVFGGGISEITGHIYASGKYGFQLITKFTNSSDRFRIRSLYNGTWTRLSTVYDDSVNKPTPADIGAVSKTGDTMTGTLSFNGNNIENHVSEISGAFSRGLMFYDKSSANTSGGIGVFGSNGNIDHIFISVGTNAPWDGENGLQITKDSIRWKGKELQTKD